MSTETPTTASGGLSERPNSEQPAGVGESPGAGWYADPNAESQLRWWNGDDWSDAVRPTDDSEGGAAPSQQATPAKGRRLMIAGAGILGVCAVAAFAASSLGSREVTVDFTIDVDKACWETSVGYSDIGDGTVVSVESGSGEVLGFGLLDGAPSGYRCDYSAVFTVEKSPDGLYVVTAGRESRGELTYTDSDIEDGVLAVRANLG